MDYIDVMLDDGTISKMEVVTMFKLDKFIYNYIIYCELDKSHYYIARINDDGLLDTNLSDEEMRLCNGVFKGVVRE